MNSADVAIEKIQAVRIGIATGVPIHRHPNLSGCFSGSIQDAAIH